MDLNLFNLVRLDNLWYWGDHCCPQLFKGFMALLIPLEDYVLLCEPAQWQYHHNEPFDELPDKLDKP